VSAHHEKAAKTHADRAEIGAKNQAPEPARVTQNQKK
jgi:hypothetical protein